ncbi:hypothetical protein NQ314_002172, partial [Rhamnusium bicolor]
AEGKKDWEASLTSRGPSTTSLFLQLIRLSENTPPDAARSQTCSKAGWYSHLLGKALKRTVDGSCSIGELQFRKISEKIDIKNLEKKINFGKTGTDIDTENEENECPERMEELCENESVVELIAEEVNLENENTSIESTKEQECSEIIPKGTEKQTKKPVPYTSAGSTRIKLIRVAKSSDSESNSSAEDVDDSDRDPLYEESSSETSSNSSVFIDTQNVADVENPIVRKVACYNLEAVLPTPRGEVFVFYYKQKLNSYNFTISKLKSDRVECYFWHEGLGKRGSNEIGTCVYNFLEETSNSVNSDDLVIVLYSDNCCGQQKNRFIFNLYMHEVTVLKIKAITHKFVIKGHTQNEDDSIYSVIEKFVKKSLRVSITLESHGLDNPAFENPHYRKVSVSSNDTEEERVRKKNIFNNLNNAPPSDFIVNEVDEDDRTWWYNFCLKCKSKDEGKPSWEPKWWPKLCPHPFWPSYRQFSRIVSLAFIGTFSWCILYAIVGDTAAPPDGVLFQLIILSICSYIGGWLMSLTTFPALVGMLLTGILFQNVNIVDINESFAEITKEIGHGALVIILIRAGLDLDPVALKRLTFTVLKLSLIPFIVEAGAITVLSRYFLEIAWSYAVLLGSIIAAVSPAVVVPCLFRLRSKGYGVAKGIPTLIIAVASIDDAASVAVFGIIKGIMFSDSSLTSNMIFGPLSIIGGIGFGVVWGILCSFVPERNDPFMTPFRILLLLTGGMAAVFGSELIGYGGAGPLGCVAAAFVAMACWSKQGWEIDENPAATAFEIFWLVIQPILFGYTGARIKFNELDGSVVSISLGILVGAVLLRILSTILIGFGCKLNLKEKVFVSISWMCKAIVQAALGPVALTMVEHGTEEYVYAEKILTTCILSIIVTAPTGALLTTLLGPHLLTKGRVPGLQEVRIRKKSRMSLRDLSISDEEEFQTEGEKNNTLTESNDKNITKF